MRVVGGGALLLLAIIPNTEATILALRTTNKKTSQEIKEVVKGFQAPPLASKQPSIPYGKCIVFHFGNIDVLTKSEPLKTQIFYCP